MLCREGRPTAVLHGAVHATHHRAQRLAAEEVVHESVAFAAFVLHPDKTVVAVPHLAAHVAHLEVYQPAVVEMVLFGDSRAEVVHPVVVLPLLLVLVLSPIGGRHKGAHIII